MTEQTELSNVPVLMPQVQTIAERHIMKANALTSRKGSSRQTEEQDRIEAYGAINREVLKKLGARIVTVNN